MAIDDLQALRARRALYIQAEEVILSGGQSYQIKDRSLQRANLKEIQAGIAAIQAQIDGLNPITGAAPRRRSISLTPRG